MSPQVLVKVISFWKFTILSSKCLEYGWSQEIFLFWWSIQIRVLFRWEKELPSAWCSHRMLTSDDCRMDFSEKLAAPILLKLIRHFYSYAIWYTKGVWRPWIRPQMRTEVIPVSFTFLLGTQLSTWHKVVAQGVCQIIAQALKTKVCLQHFEEKMTLKENGIDKNLCSLKSIVCHNGEHWW
jgi:hypothetical protein